VTRRRHRTQPAAPPPLNPGLTHHHTWVDNPVYAITDPDEPGFDPQAPPFVCQECPATAQACTSPVHRKGQTVPCGQVIEGPDRTCPDCVSRARNDLRGVRDMYRQLPDIIASIAGLHAVRYDRGAGGKPGKVRATDTTILGGEALVLSAGGTTRTPTLGRGETSIDPALLAAEQTDPPSLLAVLIEWEDRWRTERDDPVAETTSVDAAVDYLREHTEWAAQRSASWDAWLRALSDLRWRLRRLTGDTRPREQEEPTPCVHCGGPVVRAWSKAGLSDVRTCKGCGAAWPNEERLRHIETQVVFALPDGTPDALVTIEEAKMIYRGRVRSDRFDAWAKSLPPARDQAGQPMRDEAGRTLYRLGVIDGQVKGGAKGESA
jgi:hypothetical protein